MARLRPASCSWRSTTELSGREAISQAPVGGTVSEDGDGRHRVLFPMSYYSENKDAVKAPIKELDLSWQFLGREGGDTKGRYTGEGVQVFAKYTDEHADFTISGDDEGKIQTILDAWDEMPTLTPEEDEVPPSPAEQEEAKEVRVWRFKKPTQRPGEPDALFERRLEAWQEEDPREG